MKGARVQTSCSRGLQSPPALTLPLPEADVNSRGRETERTLLWFNQVPVQEKFSSETSGEAGEAAQGREMGSRVRAAAGDGAGHHPPELHLPAEDGVGPTARMKPQEVSIPAEVEEERREDKWECLKHLPT